MATADPSSRDATPAPAPDHLRATDDNSRVPVVVITGFLGSGKTTLLNGLLAQAAMLGSAVAINEFGEVGIDGDLVTPHASGPQAVLAGGCFCCSLSASFGDELLRLYHRAAGCGRGINRLVVEMTGIGEPSDLIGFIIGNPVAARLLRLETIVCTVDAVFAHGYLDEYPEAAAQIAIADTLVMTKSDLAQPAALDRLAQALTAINPRARIIVAAKGNLPAEELLGANHAAPAMDNRQREDHGGHKHGVASFVLESERPLDRRLFSRWLTSVKVAHGRSLLRAKGILYFHDEAAPFAVQGVQHVFEAPTELSHVAEPGSHSRMVFIAKDSVGDPIKESWRELLQASARERKA